MIKFIIGGRVVDPNNIKDALMSAVLDGIRSQIIDKVGTIRDPETGEFPTIVVRGDDIDNLTLHVEGSEQLVILVEERLGMETVDETQDSEHHNSPHVFLCYTSDNSDLAEKVAKALTEKGIEVWRDKWCIYPGDSLRQKIDKGISECTHFLVLLTPQSVTKPWVNQEMDAGLVRKLKDQCRFLPIRHNLEVSSLPPLLSGMHSPELNTDDDITQLTNDIWGVSRRPTRGQPPDVVKTALESETGYSAAATSIARLFVERTKYAEFADHQISITDLASETGLSIEDTKDALYELSLYIETAHEIVLAKGILFTDFDCYWKPWNPADDALRVAAGIVNDPDFPTDCRKIAEQYGWEPRRMNPAIYYLLEQDIIYDLRTLGSHPWAMLSVRGNDNTRRFVKSRS